MRYDFRNQFEEFTSSDINRDFIGAEQRRLLREWMGVGRAGAQAANPRQLPTGLDVGTLRAYHEIARRIIAGGHDALGTQAARLQLIEQAFDALSE